MKSVYQISVKFKNKTYFYIGQTSNVKTRWTTHQRNLSTGNIYANKEMLKVYNAGASDFTKWKFEVLASDLSDKDAEAVEGSVIERYHLEFKKLKKSVLCNYKIANGVFLIGKKVSRKPRYGSNNPMYKYTESDRQEIREDRASGMTLSEIVIKHDVPKTTVHKICKLSGDEVKELRKNITGKSEDEILLLFGCDYILWKLMESKRPPAPKLKLLSNRRNELLASAKKAA